MRTTLSVSTLLLLTIVSSSLAIHRHSDLPTHFSKSKDETDAGYEQCHAALERTMNEVNLIAPNFKEVKDTFVDEGSAFEQSTLDAIKECKKFQMKDI